MEYLKGSYSMSKGQGSLVVAQGSPAQKFLDQPPWSNHTLPVAQGLIPPHRRSGADPITEKPKNRKTEKT